MSETRSRTSSGPRRFMGGAVISANRTGPSSRTLSVSKSTGQLPPCRYVGGYSRCGPPWNVSRSKARDYAPHTSQGRSTWQAPSGAVSGRPGSPVTTGRTEMDVASLADLLHETADRHDPYDKTHPPHNWWDWYAPYM